MTDSKPVVNSMNLLVISRSFPPAPVVSAKRYAEMIPYLADLGCQITVICAQSPVNQEPKQMVDRIIFAGVHPRASLKKNQHERWVKKLLAAALRHLSVKFYLFDRTFFSWYFLIRNDVLRALNDAKIDVIVASYGPAGALWLGRYLSKKLGAPWVADYRDLGALKGGNNVVSQLEQFIERQMLRSSSGAITVSETLAKVIRDNYFVECEVVYNGFQPAKEIVRNEAPVSKYMYYAGTIYDHRLASIYLLLRAVRNIDILIVFRSLGPKESDIKISRFAEQLGVANKLRLLSPVNDDIVTSEAKNALINLVFEDTSTTSLWSRGTLTGKFLSLLRYKGGVLAIARADNDIGPILQKTGKGVLASTEKEIHDFVVHQLKVGDLPGNEKEILTYSKGYQSRRLYEILTTVLDRYKASINVLYSTK